MDVCGVILGTLLLPAQRNKPPISRIAPGTVRDYFDDFKVILHISAFRKVVEQVSPPPQTKAMCHAPARNFMLCSIISLQVLENCIVVILGRICVSPSVPPSTLTFPPPFNPKPSTSPPFPPIVHCLSCANFAN